MEEKKSGEAVAMSSFLKEFSSTWISSKDNQATTEKGAIGYASTLNPLVDFNFKVGSSRSADEETIISGFMKAFYDDKLVAMKWLFFARDIRGGMGERRLFRIILNHLAKEHTAIIKGVLALIAEYGRYDDLMVLFDTPLEKNMLRLIKRTLYEDLDKLEDGVPVSLLGKWLPSRNTSSYKTRMLAEKVIKGINISPRDYRKMCSSLRRSINIVEAQMSSNRWSEIDYSAVPSRANLLYADAFLARDSERRSNFLDRVVSGNQTMHAGTLFPHDIVHRYRYDYGGLFDTPDITLEELWKALPNYIDRDTSTLVVLDGSGSMQSYQKDTLVTYSSIATSLALYFAERTIGTFKNSFITFSMTPQLVKLSGKSLHHRLSEVDQYMENDTTNIEKVFNLVLKTAISTSMSQDELPENILIISDMEFDHCVYENENEDEDGAESLVKERTFAILQQRFENNGYKMPRIIFWNVSGDSSVIPMVENELGVVLFSGFSPIVLKMVLSEEKDTYNALLEMLNTERYAPIEKSMKENI